MSTRGQLMSLMRDVVTALVVVVIVLLSLWTYGGRWPPMVVVESESMQHSNTYSSVGVIDTGDLTFVRTLQRSHGVVPWVQGEKDGYSRHGGYGDVIVYHKNGLTSVTPIIHRAIVWIEWNASAQGYDVPSMGLGGVRGGFTIRDLPSYNTGEREDIDLWVNVSVIINNFKTVSGRTPHSGYLTKGDHNREIDQVSLPAWTSLGTPPVGLTRLVEPVEKGWIVGVARGELPWFGLIKLWVNGQTGQRSMPSNSGPDLGLTVALLLFVPMLFDVVAAELRRRRPKERATGKSRRRRGRDKEPEPPKGPLQRLAAGLGRLVPGRKGGPEDGPEGGEEASSAPARACRGRPALPARILALACARPMI
jgi:signal peptidase